MKKDRLEIIGKRIFFGGLAVWILFLTISLFFIIFGEVGDWVNSSSVETEKVVPYINLSWTTTEKGVLWPTFHEAIISGGKITRIDW